MYACKLQIGCMLIIFYIIFVYYKECRRFRQKHRISIYDGLLVMGILCIGLDIATVYMVNHVDEVNETLNMICHMFFLLSIDSFIFILFIYMMSITELLPRKTSSRIPLYIPFFINVFVVVYNIPQLQYIEGKYTNYSMGISAYTCFIMAGIYILLTLGLFIKRKKFIVSHKRLSIFTYLAVLLCITAYQMYNPQALLSSICVTMIILGVYVNQENPTVVELAHYHKEMVMGFATLVENKDGSTGGHIRRTTAYVKLLVEELRDRGYYKDILTKDYIENLCMAAPMHDIGKIAVPDVILQKPGKLTDDEFDIIKRHSADGGKVIQETFGHLEDRQYTKLAYEVARYHHEKWNGKGYPEGLKETEIPLGARIMAIADVFDAVSEKRCYKEAFPIDKCFEIIEDGSGRDFDPILVEIFLDIRDKVIEVYNNSKH